MKTTTDPRGETMRNNHMFGVWFTHKGEKCEHRCFAEAAGHALYSAHTYLQHKLGLSANDYEVTGMDRLLRYLRSGQLVPDIAGRVPIDDFLVTNPVVPVPPARVLKKDADDTLGAFEFIEDVPKLTRNDIERQQAKECIVDPEWMKKKGVML